MPVLLAKAERYGQWSGTVMVAGWNVAPSVIVTVAVVGWPASGGAVRRVTVTLLPETTAVTRGWFEEAE